MNQNEIIDIKQLLFAMFEEGQVELCPMLKTIVCEQFNGVFRPLQDAILSRDNESIRRHLIAYLEENSSPDGINYRRWFEDDVEEFDWVNNMEHPALFWVEWLTKSSKGYRRYFKSFSNRSDCKKFIDVKKHQDRVADLTICCDLWSNVYRRRFTTDYEFANII